MVGAGPVGAGPGVGLVTEAESMAAFKARVDELLVRLEDSAAAPERMAGDRLPRGELGPSALREGAFLYATYAVVHDELAALSRLLATRLDGLGGAVRASRACYADVDRGVGARVGAVRTGGR